LPKIKAQFNLKAMYHRTLLTQGIGESFLADELTDWENRLRASGLSLAYLPSPGMVKLRITSFEGESRKDELEAYFEEVIARFPKHVFGRENDTLSEVVGNLLLEQHATVGTVESCTGGAIAQALVQTPGSSAYFQGGYLTYSYALKQQLVQVDARILESYGAVSQEVVEQMALNGRKNLGVDYCVAASGIAGPDGGMEGKPVGTVWIAVAHPDGVVAKRFLFGDNRARNIQMSVLTALNLLRCQLASC
jgi:nicotinamide-nucleotide amidase